jgi:hypothetical protein
MIIRKIESLARISLLVIRGLSVFFLDLVNVLGDTSALATCRYYVLVYTLSVIPIGKSRVYIDITVTSLFLE